MGNTSYHDSEISARQPIPNCREQFFEGQSTTTFTCFVGWKVSILKVIQTEEPLLR